MAGLKKIFLISLLSFALTGCAFSSEGSAPVKETSAVSKISQAKPQKSTQITEKDVLGHWVWEQDKTQIMDISEEEITISDCPYTAGWILQDEVIYLLPGGGSGIGMPKCSDFLTENMLGANSIMTIKGDTAVVTIASGEKLKFTRAQK